jgi:glycosyltransferase involved in cell wall biosynthesis
MKRDLRFHVLGVPHTVTSSEYVACAYTQKAYKFGKMFTGIPGVRVFHYGHESSDLKCDEHVTVTTDADLEKAYGSYDWKAGFFRYNTNDHAYQTFYRNAIREIKSRWQPGDFVLAFWGAGVRPVCDAIEKECKTALIVEPGIGYPGGHWAKWKVWESYSIMHAMGGQVMVGRCRPQWNDVVIPNYFDPEEFSPIPESEKEDYFLYLGRVYDGKGVKIAIETADRAGVKLVVAGQPEAGYVLPSNVEYVGYADVETRKSLMSRAKGSFLPSLYYEPFGGVQMENLFSGTPTITTDWGAFSENNLHGVTGYRCRTQADWDGAVRRIQEGRIKSSACLEWAQNFSLDRVRPRYLKYFRDIHASVFGDEVQEDEDGLDALSMKYPRFRESDS